MGAGVILQEAQDLGLIGAGDLRPHIEHALGFAAALQSVRGKPPQTTDLVLDLGSGGGLPGLVLAMAFDWTVRLLEGSLRRAAWLERAVTALSCGDQVEVVSERAEEAGRHSRFRGTHSVVVARAFGSPSETAECGAPLLEVGGYLVVSEPPDGSGVRWTDVGVAQVGLELVSDRHGVNGYHYAVLRQALPCPDRYPRRVGVPRKRPLF